MSAASFKAAYQLIHAGRYDEAHRLLLALAATHPGDTNVWLLLGWTAPSRRSARAYFERLLSLQPQNPLALDGLTWSNTGWDALPDESRRRPGSAASPAAPRLAGAAGEAARRGAETERGVSPAPASPPRRRSGSASAETDSSASLGLLGLYLAGLALAESVTTFLHPQLGLIIHGVLLALLFLHAALWATGPLQKLLYCLALAPLIRLMSLSMPLAQLQPVFWYAIIGLPLFLASLLAMRISGYTPAEVGLALGRRLPLQALTALSGLGLGYLEYRILSPAPLAPTFSLGSIWLPALILLIFTGFLEELIFRGLMQRASQALLGNLGAVYVSLAFAVLHIGYRSLADFAFVFAVGLLFSLIAERSRSVLGVTLAHGLTNISLFLVFPFILK